MTVARYLTNCAEKVEAVKSWPRPTTITEVKSFVGLCSYRQFKPSFADVVQPLYQCTNHNTPFQWMPEAENAFQKLKLAITDPSIP
jgi:hypothetical protein